MKQSLFEKIGGKDTVGKAAKILYVNILRDDRLKRFFEGTDMQKQERMMGAFLTNILGGPSLYTGNNRGTTKFAYHALRGVARATLAGSGVQSRFSLVR